MHHASHHSSHQAFTLVELLMVISVMVVLMGLVTPIIAPVMDARRLRQAGQSIADELEGARLYATTHQTTVWVGLTTDSEKRLVLAKVAAKYRGVRPTATDLSLASSATTADITALGPVRKMQQVALQTLAATDRPAVTTSLESVTTPIFSFKTGPSNAAQTFDRWVIEIASSGEMGVVSGSLSKTIEIGLQPAVRGVVKAGEANFVALQISGLTGMTRIYQP